MSGTEISALPSASAANTTDIFPATQGASGPNTGTTRGVTAAQLLGIYISTAMEPVTGGSTLGGAISALMADNNTFAQGVYSAIFPGVTFNDNIQGCNTLNSAGIVQRTGIAGYVRGQFTASAGDNNSVALFGAGTAEVDGAATWGINTLLMDSATRTVGTGTGRFLVNEFDFNVMNPATQVIGLSLGGNSLAQPSTSNAFICNVLGSGIRWGGGFVTEDAAAVTGIAIGLNTTLAANVSSQTILMGYGDISGTRQTVEIQATSAGGSSPGGFVAINGTAATHLSVANGDVELLSGTAFLVIGGTSVVTTRQTGWNGPTGTLLRGTFDTGTATLTQTAETLGALIADLRVHGLIGT